DRHVGSGAVDAVDDLERPVVLTALAGDEDDVDLTALEGPNGFVDAVRQPDQLKVGVVRQGPLDVEGVQAFDGNECADGAFHGSYFCPLIWARSWVLVIDFFGAFFASPAGRRRNHNVPESDARASVWASPASARRIA